jgi:hypothetical protein
MMANLTREQRAQKEAEEAAERVNELTDGNGRLPTEAVREGAHPITKAAGALAVGTPGTMEPPNPEDLAVATVVTPSVVVPMRKIVFLRGYFAKEGGKKIASGTEMDLPIEDARYLIECGIAKLVDTI